VQQALAQGTLVAASPHRSPTDRAYWLCWPKPVYRPMTASVVAFRDWLLTQADSTH
jgi:DNA-binding transcriptional LysR family regulator